MKIEKRIHVINMGYINSKELYKPDCELTNIVLDLFRGYSRKNLVLEDLLTFRNAGWEIHYTGKKSNKLHLVNAIFDGDVSKE